VLVIKAATEPSAGSFVTDMVVLSHVPVTWVIVVVQLASRVVIHMSSDALSIVAPEGICGI
jgi:hypothetical protein